MPSISREDFLSMCRRLHDNPTELTAMVRSLNMSELWCTNCGEVVDAIEHHCRSCGALSVHFSHDLFKELWGCTLEEEMADNCNVGHPKGTTAEEAASKSYGFCMHCGQLLEATQ